MSAPGARIAEPFFKCGTSAARQSMPPEYCGRGSHERSCSFTMTLTGSCRSALTRSTPRRLSDEAGDQVGA